MRWFLLAGLIGPLSSLVIFSPPMRTEIQLSGSFAEYRTGHLHAGIDIRTMSLNNIPLYAMADGWVRTLHGTEYHSGFGCALYVAHDDDYVAVYGHLNRLADVNSMEAGWQMARLMHGSWFTVQLPPWLFAVRRGDVIAYSGEKGIGASHLHLEVQNSRGDHYNPLSFINVPDYRRPELHNAHVIQGNRVSSCRLKANATGQYSCDQKFIVTSPFYFSISTHDPANLFNRLGVYRLDASVDGSMVYSAQFDFYRKGEASRIWTVYDVGRTKSLPGYTYRLLSPEGSIPGWIKIAQNRGIIDPSEWAVGSRHIVQIDVSDIAGNKSTALFEVTKSEPSPAEVKPVVPEQPDERLNLKAGALPGYKDKSFILEGPALPSPARLTVRKTRPGSDPGVKRIGDAYSVEYEGDGRPALEAVFLSAEKKGRTVYPLDSEARYNARKRGYVFQLRTSGTYYLGDDTSAPEFTTDFIRGPLMQDYLILPVSERGSGVDPYGSDIWLEGEKLDARFIRRWGVRYDRDRYALLFPTGIASWQRPVDRPVTISLWVRVRDKAGNASGIWQGYITMLPASRL